MSDLVGNPEARFSRVKAHLLTVVIGCTAIPSCIYTKNKVLYWERHMLVMLNCGVIINYFYQSAPPCIHNPSNKIVQAHFPNGFSQSIRLWSKHERSGVDPTSPCIGQDILTPDSTGQ